MVWEKLSDFGVSVKVGELSILSAGEELSDPGRGVEW
jgi:hypothetical protein